MKRITLLIATLFAFLINAMADIPATGALGYFYNPSTGRFIGITSEYAPVLNETGTEYGIRNEGAATEFSGFTYIRIAVHDEYMKLDKKGTEEASNANSTGNCLRLVTTLTSKNAGYHKWAAQDSEKGWLIRCIYTQSQISTDYEPQGYYLAASISADGTASLTMSKDLTEACYWKFVSGDDYETAKASANDVFAAAKVAAFNALVDALLESVPTDTENMDADVKSNLQTAVEALQAEKKAENYSALEKAIAAANESIANNKQAAENAEKLKDMKVGDDITELLIQNANFNDGVNGWTINNGKIEVKAASSGNPVVTAYDYTFDVGQTLRGMTKGWYQLKVQAFSRPASNADVLKLLEAGTELENNCYIYGNTEEKKVVQLTDEMQKEKLTDYKEYTYNDETIYLPDGSSAFAAAFTKGLYENELKIEVGDDGILKFGIKNTKSPSEQGPTYCGYDNFRLIYLGDDPVTAISSVTKKASVKSIFNLAGQQMNGLQKGLNIVDGKKIYVK